MSLLMKYWPLLAAIIGATMWLGALQQRVVQLEQRDRYEHGSYQLPGGK